MAKKATKDSSEQPNAEGLMAFLDKSDVHGFPISHWTFSQFIRAYPSVSHLVKILGEKGYDLSLFESFDAAKDVPVVIDALVPVLPELLRATCPDKDEAYYEALPYPAAIQIGVALLVKNATYLMDFFIQSPEK